MADGDFILDMKLKQEIGRLCKKMDALKTSIEALTFDVDLSSLDTTNTLLTNLQAIIADIATIESEVTDGTTASEGVNTGISTLNGKIDTIDSVLDSIDSLLTTIDGKVDTLDAVIDTISSTLTTLNSTIGGSMKYGVGWTKADIITTNQTLTNTSTPNMILKHISIYTSQTISSFTFTLTNSSNMEMVKINSGISGTYGYLSLNIPIPAGFKWTLNVQIGSSGNIYMFISGIKLTGYTLTEDLL